MWISEEMFTLYVDNKLPVQVLHLGMIRNGRAFVLTLLSQNINQAMHFGELKVTSQETWNNTLATNATPTF